MSDYTTFIVCRFSRQIQLDQDQALIAHRSQGSLTLTQGYIYLSRIADMIDHSQPISEP